MSCLTSKESFTKSRCVVADPMRSRQPSRTRIPRRNVSRSCDKNNHKNTQSHRIIRNIHSLKLRLSDSSRSSTTKTNTNSNDDDDNDEDDDDDGFTARAATVAFSGLQRIRYVPEIVLCSKSSFFFESDRGERTRFVVGFGSGLHEVSRAHASQIIRRMARQPFLGPCRCFVCQYHHLPRLILEVTHPASLRRDSAKLTRL